MVRCIKYLMVVIATLAMISSCEATGSNASSKEPVKFFVGSSKGNLDFSIFLCSLNPENGKFAVLDSFAGAKGPSYLALSPGKEILYAIDSEVFNQAEGFNSVTSFRMDPENYQLRKLNSQSSEGKGPCHITCSKDGDHVFVANYGSGHSAAFPIAQDGSIIKASSVVAGTGSGPVENRQRGPHAHMVSLDPENNFLLVPDLGTDKVLIYDFDRSSGLLTPNPAQAFLELDPGSGPRHLVFHPEGHFVYVVNELSSTVTACSYDTDSGKLTSLQTVSTVPESHEGAKYPAAIRIHPDGNFLYASTRGENSKLSVFRVEEDGRIYRTQEVGVTHWPRDFNIHPSGKFLLAAGERSGVIEFYHIDAENGSLSKAEGELKLPAPGCILYLE